MTLTNEIKRPSYTSDPDFVTGDKKLKSFYEFSCSVCTSKVQIDFHKQISNEWSGKSDSLSEKEYTTLKEFYNIGIVNKSHDGGFPVFDKVSCKKCGQDYLTYCGVREFYNSMFKLHLQGIVKIDK